MNARIRAQMDVSNPFAFNFIQNLKSINVNSFDDSGPSVVFASPGMLQSGVSRQLFDRWASDPKNGVMIAGYAVEHTLAKEIMAQPKEVVTLEGRKQPLNCLVVCSKTARLPIAWMPVDTKSLTNPSIYWTGLRLVFCSR
jgi:cleavage and polyadenylation specificity factor subunit 3